MDKYREQKRYAVMRMQNYIRDHIRDDDFDLDQVCSEAGYSRRHADRIFKEYLGFTLQEYVTAVSLTQSAEDLKNPHTCIVDVALKSQYQTHEGFTRSFRKRFHITPSEYREKQPAIPLFTQYPVEESRMSNEINLCMVTAKERPKRKLIYLPSKKAEDYFTYCEEMGCEWEGLLNSISEKWEPAVLMELPPFLIEEGNGSLAAGIEVPYDYDKPMPMGYSIAELEPCVMLYFQSEPYENEEDFCAAIEQAYAAIEKYNPETYGYRFAKDLAPSFNFGAEAHTGAKLAVPAAYK